jgi:hypothetical protein
MQYPGRTVLAESHNKNCPVSDTWPPPNGRVAVNLTRYRQQDADDVFFPHHAGGDLFPVLPGLCLTCSCLPGAQRRAASRL